MIAAVNNYKDEVYAYLYKSKIENPTLQEMLLTSFYRKRTERFMGDKYAFAKIYFNEFNVHCRINRKWMEANILQSTIKQLIAPKQYHKDYIWLTVPVVVTLHYIKKHTFTGTIEEEHIKTVAVQVIKYLYGYDYLMVYGDVVNGYNKPTEAYRYWLNIKDNLAATYTILQAIKEDIGIVE